MKKLIMAVSFAFCFSATAALANDVSSCKLEYNVGRFADAFQSCSAAAVQGDILSQFNLASMYYAGSGVSQSYVNAYRWYRVAAEQGFPNAQTMLANLYLGGEGVAKNYTKAAQWYLAAAKQGDTFAQHELAVSYTNGEGVVQNYVQAHLWFNIAAANGNSLSAEKRNFVAALMTPEQIAEAQTRAQQCINSNYTDCQSVFPKFGFNLLRAVRGLVFSCVGIVVAVAALV